MSNKIQGQRFSFEGKNLNTEQVVRGEVIAKNEADARSKLTRRRIKVIQLTKLKKQRQRRISQSDITVFTRQLSTMMKAGLPLMQSFDIVAKGHSNPSMTRLLLSIKSDIEQGSSMANAFAKHPKYFDKFYCNLIQAGETGGVLEVLLDKLATYKEKTQSIRKKVITALVYPAAVIVVAIALIFIMMIFVLPQFAEVYAGMGVELPALTQFMMNLSESFVSYGWLFIIIIIAAVIGFFQWRRRSRKLQKRVDAVLLKAPIFGNIVLKATLARWARTLATLFAAGVPLVEVLDSVAGASGNIVYEDATKEIRNKVNQGLTLTSSMMASHLFPNMMLQMTSIGEESGSLDDMLNKVAEFYEEEVDNAVAMLSSLMEPIIMVVLGSIIAVILVAMYLPIFNLGSAVGG